MLLSSKSLIWYFEENEQNSIKAHPNHTALLPRPQQTLLRGIQLQKQKLVPEWQLQECGPMDSRVMQAVHQA